MLEELQVVLLGIGIVLLAAIFLWIFFSKRGPFGEKAPGVPVPTGGKGLSDALAKTRGQWWSGLSKIGGMAPARLVQSEWDAFEETLIGADVSVATAERLLNGLRARGARDATDSLGSLLVQEVERLLASVEAGWVLPDQPRPYVVSLVGVNGGGKTTTVGKIAYVFSKQGKKVLLAACDTFRAAAIEQLRVWSERAGCQFVAGREGADPGATAFDAVAAGIARAADLVLLDTAGRLHTKTHLMDELKRVHKVVKKVMPDAPHQIWLVVDGTLGQNSVVQARHFHEALGVTGVVVTKLDGTARGGAVLSIVSDLKLPLRFIGVGESVQDLVPFEPKAFAHALFQNP